MLRSCEELLTFSILVQISRPFYPKECVERKGSNDDEEETKSKHEKSAHPGGADGVCLVEYHEA